MKGLGLLMRLHGERKSGAVGGAETAGSDGRWV